MSAELIAGLALLIAAGWTFVAVAKRARLERDRRDYQRMILKARRGREGWHPVSLPRRHNPTKGV